MTAYKPEGFSQEIFKKRYAIHENETWENCSLRVATHVSMAEVGENIAIYKNKFFDEINNGLFIPGGRTLYAAQRAKGQLLNCFVIGTSDSREGWGKSTNDMIVICGTGGGLGLNASPVRPRGSSINGTGGIATGAVSLMEIINAAGEVIKAGGGRRTALMMCLNLDHGDLQEFLNKKLDLNKLNNANVSVWFNENPEEFFKLVKEDGDLELKFRGKTINKLKAKEVWQKIVSNAIKSGEPGLLNGYLFNKMNNISYHAPIVSTNPCVLKGTMVKTPAGNKKVEEFKIGDIVSTISDPGIVDNIEIHENYPYYNIEIESKIGIHNLSITLAHQFYYYDNGVLSTKSLQNFQIGDCVLIDNCNDEISSDINKHLGKIKSVTYGGLGTVYDLHEPITDSWITNGIVSRGCGEIGLLEYDACCLGAIVLPKFVENNTINFAKLKNSVNIAIRFLDNVLTVNNYPLAEIKETCHSIRRLGLGVMGIHDMLLLLGKKYNSDDGLEIVDKVLEFIKNCSYEQSIELAKEKGAFPKFDADKYLKGGFAKTLKPSIRTKIKEYGIRNCALLTIAPTGTTSIIAGVTSGIEPMFAPAYYRKYRDGDELKTEVVIHPLFKEFVDAGKDVSHFQGSHDLSLKDHFEMQRVCQRHLDNACSKTINVPQGTSEQELSDLYMEYFPELKGVTIYPEGSREDQPLTSMSLDEAINHATNGHYSSLESYAKDPCKSGACDI